MLLTHSSLEVINNLHCKFSICEKKTLLVQRLSKNILALVYYKFKFLLTISSVIKNINHFNNLLYPWHNKISFSDPRQIIWEQSLVQYLSKQLILYKVMWTTGQTLWIIPFQPMSLYVAWGISETQCSTSYPSVISCICFVSRHSIVYL